MTKYIYSLDHYKDKDIESTWKQCGFFSSRKKALEASEILKSDKGFRRFPDNFLIQRIEINVLYWKGGFGSVS